MQKRATVRNEAVIRQHPMKSAGRVSERRSRAGSISWSASASHLKQLRQTDCASDLLLTPTSVHVSNLDSERADQSTSNHIEQDQSVVVVVAAAAEAESEEIIKHLTMPLSSPRVDKHEYRDDDLVGFNSDEFDMTILHRDSLGSTVANPSRHNSKSVHHATHDSSHPLNASMRQSSKHQSNKNHEGVGCRPNLPCNLISSTMGQVVSPKQSSRYMITSDLPQKILIIFIMNAILNQLSNHLIYLHGTDDKQQYRLQLTQTFPTLVSALTTTSEINIECRRDSDCDDMRCYQGKCICPKDRPIEDRGVCLPLSVVGEVCTVNEQCLGNSVCLDSYCSCGKDTISLFNPSTKIYYCHPKRRLREECSHDAQCPNNSFCSTNKCLCQNGYGPVTVKNTDGAESVECLPKSCSASRDCESDYHVCEDNRCLCLATHFDPHTADCYKFGSTGGKLSGSQTIDEKATSSNNDGAPDNDKSFGSILKDLINSDKWWYVIIILAVLTIILLALIVMGLRKCFLGYCWTAHKKEYQPNNKSAPKSGYFNKDSINNKSFRQKNGETDDDVDDNDDTAADRSNLVTPTVNKSRGALLNNGQQRPANNKELADSGNRYVKVDMREQSAPDEDQQQSYEQADSIDVHYQPYHQQLLSRPLSTSNSTAV